MRIQHIPEVNDIVIVYAEDKDIRLSSEAVIKKANHKSSKSVAITLQIENQTIYKEFELPKNTNSDLLRWDGEKWHTYITLKEFKKLNSIQEPEPPVAVSSNRLFYQPMQTYQNGMWIDLPEVTRLEPVIVMYGGTGT